MVALFFLFVKVFRKLIYNYGNIAATDNVVGRFINVRNEWLNCYITITNDSEPPELPVKSESSDGSLLLSALSPDIHCQALQL